MSDSQRFYLIIPVYLLFSAPVGTLWEWKRSVMTPNPPHKAKDWASSPCIWKRAGGWVCGHFGGLCVCVWTSRRPMGSDKSPRLCFRRPPPPPPPPPIKLSALSTNADQRSAGRAGAELLPGSRALHVWDWKSQRRTTRTLNRWCLSFRIPPVSWIHETSGCTRETEACTSDPKHPLRCSTSSFFLSFFPLKWPTMSRPLPQQGPWAWGSVFLFFL